MKKIVLLLSILIIFSCNDKEEDNYIVPINNISACECDDPLNQLEWLNEIANKALIDKTGNYQGNIWIVSQEATDYIITDMMLGSGGVYHYYFDCSGDLITIPDEQFMNNIESALVDSNMIFSTVYKK